MTREEFEQKHCDYINHLIDLNNSAGEAWAYHPENPNRIDPVQYHAILVEKIQQLEKEVEEFVAQYGQL